MWLEIIQQILEEARSEWKQKHPKNNPLPYGMRGLRNSLVWFLAIVLNELKSVCSRSSYNGMNWFLNNAFKEYFNSFSSVIDNTYMISHNSLNTVICMLFYSFQFFIFFLPAALFKVNHYEGLETILSLASSQINYNF